MHYLAAARYRFLLTIRKAQWVSIVSVAAVLIPAISAESLADPDYWYRARAGYVLRDSSSALFGIYVMQALVVLGACAAFGTRTRRATEAPVQDLLDSAPLTAHTRYWGDALGIFAAVVVARTVALPILALAFAVSPWPLAVFFYVEALLLAVVFLLSCGASWTLRSEDSRWSRTRALRSGALFGILLLTILITTSRWEELREALAQLVNEASQRAWQDIVATFDVPIVSVMLLLLLYTGFVVFYYLHSVRTAEKA